jgi:hypothetical protein
MVGGSPRCYCSFAYSALASFRRGCGVAVPKVTHVLSSVNQWWMQASRPAFYSAYDVQPFSRSKNGKQSEPATLSLNC